MRTAFIKTLIEMAEKDPKIWLLTADLGFGVIEPFRDKFPDRFINVGVAEQNMISVATGLAADGKTPFCYSISTFATMRGLEQIRHAATHNFPIRIVGVGGGFAYGPAGFTHWGLEDVGLMRMMPGMRVVAPRCPSSAVERLREFNRVPGPVYFRIGKGGEQECVRGIQGKNKILVVSLGTMAPVGIQVAKKLDADFCGIEIINPLVWYGNWMLPGYEKIVTIEEHFLKGGLFTAICEEMQKSYYNRISRVIPFGIDQLTIGKIGSRDYMLKEYGLTAEAIVERVQRS